MNLQENIRRIIREQSEDFNTTIEEYDDGFDVFIMDEDKKIGEISFAKENIPNIYTIVDATIDDEYKGSRIYPKTIINLFKERPNLIINSVFRSPEAEKSWRYILNNLPSNIGKSFKYFKDEDTTLTQLKSHNIQESIKRILREEIQFPLFIKRRFAQKELDKLVNDINKKVNNEINYNLDDIIYDNVRQLIGSKSQQIGLDQHAEESVFWPLYIKYEKPLVDYIKDRLSIE